MAGFAASSGSGLGDFPNPFIDVASMVMPQNWRTALQWCEHVYYRDGMYRQAMERIVSYFLTDIEFEGGGKKKRISEDEKDKWLDFLKGTFGIFGHIQAAGLNRLCYGNWFGSVIAPRKRFLVCPKCKAAFPLKVVYNQPVFNFAWSNMEFSASCPACRAGSGYKGTWEVDDKPDDEDRKLRLKHWNVHEIEILHDYYTDETAYLWRIPEDYKQMIKRGHLYHLERVSKPVLAAIKKNQMFRFEPDAIFHMKEPTLSGVRNRGWGIPRTFSNFRQVYYCQVLRRYNEAIALDYIVPFRLITPAPRPGAGGGGGAGASNVGDPLMMYNMNDFRSQMTAMLKKRRRDPAAWNILPFPVQYQMLGGDASKLAPVELMNSADDTLLNAIGTPVELYKGTLQLQAAPVALRLFEATWHPLVQDFNAMLNWLCRQIAQIRNWEPVDPRMKSVTIADDLQKQMMLLQLMMGGQISGTTALKTLGLSFSGEQKQLGEEAMETAETQARVSEEMDQAGFAQALAKGQTGAPGAGGGGGAAPGGAAPAGGGGGGGGAPPAGDPSQQGAMQLPVDSYIASTSGPNQPQTPEEMVQAAAGLAQNLLGLDDGTKNQQLRKLKQHSVPMHSLVRSRIDTMRRDARTQGGQQIMQQYKQQ